MRTVLGLTPRRVLYRYVLWAARTGLAAGLSVEQVTVALDYSAPRALRRAVQQATSPSFADR